MYTQGSTLYGHEAFDVCPSVFDSILMLYVAVLSGRRVRGGEGRHCLPGGEGRHRVCVIQEVD